MPFPSATIAEIFLFAAPCNVPSVGKNQLEVDSFQALRYGLLIMFAPLYTLVKSPPTYTFPLPSAARAQTQLLSEPLPVLLLPRADQFVPSHLVT